MSLDFLNNIINELGDLSPAALVCIGLFGINLLLRRTPKVPNALIPWFSVIAGMLLFWRLVPAVTNFHNPTGRNLLLGFISGLFAAFGYGAIVSFAEKKWPWLSSILNPPENTKQDEPPKTP